MSGRGVLVVLAGAEQAEACLHAADHAARVLGDAPLTVLHVRADPNSTILPTEEVLGREAIAKLTREEAVADRTLAALVEIWGTDRAVWRSVAGDEAAEIVRRAANTALVVLPRPDHARPGHGQAIEAVLFTARLPALVVPPGPGTPFGRHIAVGWKEERALGRACAAFAAFLRAADRVTLVGVGQRGSSLATAREVLARFRSDAETVAVAAGSAPVGRLLLEAAREITADSLLIGAYARGETLEWLLGGVTRTVLREATIPLFLRH